MTQTTGGLSWVDAEIEISTDGAAYTDISGHSNSVEIAGGERVTGAAYTADGDTAIIKRGKRQPLTVTVNVIYTEPTNSPYNTFQTAYESPTGRIDFRWSPAGGDGSELQYTSSAGIPKQPPYPVGNSDSGDPLMVSLVIECASISEASV